MILYVILEPGRLDHSIVLEWLYKDFGRAIPQEELCFQSPFADRLPLDIAEADFGRLILFPRFEALRSVSGIRASSHKLVVLARFLHHA